MTTWQQIDANRFIIRSKGKVITVNTIQSLTAYTMAFNKHTTIDEIEYALLEMNRNGHDYCEFGVYGKFVFSKRMVDEKAH
jgi:hypothetical protein